MWNRPTTIDLDGDFYLCDELMGNPRYKTKPGVELNAEEWMALNIREECKKCKIRGICAGRCLHTLLVLPSERLKIYCDAAKMLIGTVNSFIPHIQRYLQLGIIDRKQLFNSIALDSTEIIP